MCQTPQLLLKLRYFGKEYVTNQYCAGGKIEKNEMGRACGAYGERERGAQGLGGEA
jgi:hypothetical protein